MSNNHGDISGPPRGAAAAPSGGGQALKGSWPARALLLALAITLSLPGCRSAPQPSSPASPVSSLAGLDVAAPAGEPWLPALPPSLAPETAGPSRYAADLRQGFEGDVAAQAAPTVYRIAAHLDDETRLLSVQQEVRYVNRAPGPLGEVYFRLVPNQRGHRGSLTVDRVQVPGRRAGWALVLEDTALRLELEPPLLPGEPLRVILGHRVVVPESNPVGYGIFSTQDGVFTLGHFYAWIPMYDQDGWHLDPLLEFGDVTFTDVALYDVTLTASAGLRVAGTGRVVDVRLNADGSQTTRLVAGPVRDFGLVVGRGLSSLERAVGGIRVLSYYLEGYDEEGKAALDYAAGAVRVFERRFGPYPYTELKVVQAPVRGVGMEYPGLVLVGEHVYRPPAGTHTLPLEFVVVHELAHQWWYGLVGSDQPGEPWLDEALAAYAAILYFEDLYGPERARLEMERTLENPYASLVALGQDLPVRQPVVAFTRQNYYGIVYGKGALFFEGLRRQVGDECFDRILQAYYHTYRYKNARADDFYRIVQREAGARAPGLELWWQANAPPRRSSE